MMWMMIICCLVPIVFILVTSQGLDLGVVGWIILAVAVVCLLIHLFGMRRKQHSEKSDSQIKSDK